MVHVFVDFEMNQVAWADRKLSGDVKNEIIQIGAVKLDENYRVLAIYETYVRPIFSRICPICSKLTGIVQSNVDHANFLPEAVQDFLDWVDDQNARYYSWSDNDSRQLRSELACKGADALAEQFQNWTDFQKEYCDLVGQSRMGLDIALAGAGLRQIGCKHTAASDALSSVQLLKLIHNPAYFAERPRQRIVQHTEKVRAASKERRQAVKAKCAQKQPAVPKKETSGKPVGTKHSQNS